MNKSAAALRVVLAPGMLLMLLAVLPASAAAQSEGERFSFSGERTTIRFRENERYTLLSGSARIETGNLLIEADEIELYGPDFRYLDCSGSVSMKEKEKGITLNTVRLFYDRETELTRVSGFTELFDPENELSARCYYLEQEGESGDMVLQAAVKIDTVSDGSAVVCRAEMARYDRGAKTLELLGSPVVDWKGDEYRADRIVIDTARDTIRMEGSVSGSLTEEAEEAP